MSFEEKKQEFSHEEYKADSFEEAVVSDVDFEKATMSVLPQGLPIDLEADLASFFATAAVSTLGFYSFWV